MSIPVDPKNIVKRQTEMIGQQATEIVKRDAAIEVLQGRIRELEAQLASTKAAPAESQIGGPLPVE